MQDLICISHLRWDFVWQRPQQLLSRLAQHGRVLFVEEPVTNPDAQEPYLEVYPGRAPDGARVTVVRLMQPADSHYWIGHDDPRTQKTYERLLRDYLIAEEYQNPALWLYTPMALPFVDVIQPHTLIYDVMDELSAFKGAPPELQERDQAALARADIVFTGGASLYRSRAPHNRNTHLFPSGVEVDHFSRAASKRFARPHDLEHIPAPILGYFGVVDERMDLPLLSHLAESHPEWQVVMVGPVIKISPEQLPQAPNLHYLGMKEYTDLPAYLSYFDVALVPFAINETTRFLSPTKTLEYIAAHKPVVSTPIPDILELYGSFVSIGHTPEEFIASVEDALRERDDVRKVRVAAEKKLLAKHTWDHIAGKMRQIIEENSKKDDAAEQIPVQLPVLGAQRELAS